LLVGRDTLLMLPRTGDDDIAALGPRRSQDPAAVAALLESEFRWIRALGGLYALSYHSQLLAKPVHLPALARLARTIASDSTVWIATAADVATWWRGRSQLQTSVRLADKNKLVITVRNRGQTGVRGGVIRVHQPSPLTATRSTGQLLPSEPGVIRVLIPFIAPGDRKVIAVAATTPDPR
jgi:hypothetical protein